MGRLDPRIRSEPTALDPSENAILTVPSARAAQFSEAS
jgi:hypothetical protein